MSDYKQDKASKHVVVPELKGKINFFKVRSVNSEKVYDVTLQFNCTCENQHWDGKKGKICGHVKDTLKKIIELDDSGVNKPTYQEMLNLRRMACLNLIRTSNRVLNEVRVSSGETKAHQDKKIEICKRLEEEGKFYICEAIFTEDRGRADILVLDDQKIIEITNTETAESILEKAKKYPKGLKIEVIKA